MPRVIVIKGADEGKQFELTGDHVGVGRDAANPIRLHDTEVSRRHAEFVLSPEGYRILDIGSANGTYVNGQAIHDVLLQAGDQILIGQSVLVYSTGQVEAPPPSDLAAHISLITRQDLELSSAIVKAVGEGEGSRILARPDKVEGPWLKSALANLGVMYEAIQAVSHILDLNQLLERIMDLIFRTLEADRGCIMLRREDDGSGERGHEGLDSARLEPKAVRWRDGVNRQEKMPVSRTIMDYALKEKKGILVSDAARDQRFQAVQSIVRFGVREVICVPMKGRHETLGVLYLDTQTSARELTKGDHAGGKFTEDHLSLAIAIAHQAALAVEETRYHHAMVQAERLAAVGQTIAALSHHIKNILQGLHTGGDIVKRGLQDRDLDYIGQGWRIVEKNQSRIYELVMDMLSYSKEREPNIANTDLNSVARDVAEMLSARVADRGIRLETRLDPKLPVCPADEEGIHRALLNIAVNAVDAVEGIEKPEVLISSEVEPDGAWVRLIVRDNGAGIPREKQEEIFRPFISTKGSRGTGLGLAVSRKILREHGGDILVQSQPGQGSLFLLRLPLRSPVAKEPQRTQIDIPVVKPPEEA